MPRQDAETIICTVDVVLLTLRQDQLHVVLLKRDREPFRNALALPGGYVHIDTDQSAADAAARVLLGKTGIVSPYLEQLASFTGPGRDPRGWSVSIAYYALVPEGILPAHDEGVHVVPVNRLPSLPFDHKSIVEHALDRVRSKSLYSSLPVYLCGESFTLPQLQAVYESVLGEPINKVSFRRKVEELGMLEAIEGEMQSGRANRPAQMYRLRKEFRHSLSMLDRGLNSRMS
jgi:8-oxo-dGTP diphosphatase